MQTGQKRAFFGKQEYDLRKKHILDIKAKSF